MTVQLTLTRQYPDGISYILLSFTTTQIFQLLRKFLDYALHYSALYLRPLLHHAVAYFVAVKIFLPIAFPNDSNEERQEKVKQINLGFQLGLIWNNRIFPRNAFNPTLEAFWALKIRLTAGNNRRIQWPLFF